MRLVGFAAVVAALIGVAMVLNHGAAGGEITSTLVRIIAFISRN